MLLFAARGNLDMCYCEQLSWKVMLQLARMSFIKRHKNVYLSLGSYVIAFSFTYFVPALIWPPFSSVSPTLGYFFLGLSLIFVIIGIIFAYKSNKQQESSWAGNLLLLIGLLIVFSVFFIKSACTPAYN